MTEISMWDAPAGEVATERLQQAHRLASAAVEPLWPFLSQAKTLPEFDQRVALSEESLIRSVASVVTDDSLPVNEIRLVATKGLRERFEASLGEQVKQALFEESLRAAVAGTGLVCAGCGHVDDAHSGKWCQHCADTMSAADPNHTFVKQVTATSNEHPGGSYQPTGQTFTDPCGTCSTPVTFEWYENDGGFRTAVAIEPDSGSDQYSSWCPRHVPARRRAASQTTAVGENGSKTASGPAVQRAVQRGMMMGSFEHINEGAMLPSMVYTVMEPGPNGARPTDRKTADMDEAERWAEELLKRTDWKPYTSARHTAVGENGQCQQVNDDGVQCVLPAGHSAEEHDFPDLKGEGEIKAAAARWPMKPNPNFPGEQMAACPVCGGDVVMEGTPLSQKGKFPMGTTLVCKENGHRTYFPDDSRTAASKVAEPQRGNAHSIEGVEFRTDKDGYVGWMSDWGYALDFQDKGYFVSEMHNSGGLGGASYILTDKGRAAIDDAPTTAARTASLRGPAVTALMAEAADEPYLGPADEEGYITSFGRLKDFPCIVRTTNGGETGPVRVSTHGSTYGMDVQWPDGHWSHLLNYRVVSIKPLGSKTAASDHDNWLPGGHSGGNEQPKFEVVIGDEVKGQYAEREDAEDKVRLLEEEGETGAEIKEISKAAALSVCPACQGDAKGCEACGGKGVKTSRKTAGHSVVPPPGREVPEGYEEATCQTCGEKIVGNARVWLHDQPAKTSAVADLLAAEAAFFRAPQAPNKPREQAHEIPTAGREEQEIRRQERVRREEQQRVLEEAERTRGTQQTAEGSRGDVGRLSSVRRTAFNPKMGDPDYESGFIAGQSDASTGRPFTPPSDAHPAYVEGYSEGYDSIGAPVHLTAVRKHAEDIATRLDGLAQSTDNGGPNISNPVTTRPRVMPGGGIDPVVTDTSDPVDNPDYAPVNPMRPTVGQRVQARIARLTAKIRTDNPTMAPDAARALAARTVAAYPEMVATAGESRGVSGTCPVCYRENLTLTGNGKIPAHKDSTRDGSPQCEGSGKDA